MMSETQTLILRWRNLKMSSLIYRLHKSVTKTELFENDLQTEGI